MPQEKNSYWRSAKKLPEWWPEGFSLESIQNQGDVFIGRSNRIAALKFEDRIRSSTMFQRHFAVNPTASTDIAPQFDLIENIPTHVKLTKSDSIMLACAWQFWRLRGTQRFIIGLYDEEYRTGDDGKTELVKCVFAIIELFMSDETLAALRGDIAEAEIYELKRLLMNFDPRVDNTSEGKEVYHAITGEMRSSKRMGKARVSCKINEDNKRPQAQVSISAIYEQLQKEPSFAGRNTYGSWKIHTDTFHGIQLPWRTTDKVRIFKAARDPESRKLPVLTPEEQKVEEYLRKRVSVRHIPIEKGKVIFFEHEDGRFSAVCDTDDRETRRKFRILLRAANAEKLHNGRWLLTQRKAKWFEWAMTQNELPENRQNEILRRSPSSTDRERYGFTTGGKWVNILKVHDRKWIIYHNECSVPVGAACTIYGIGEIEEDKKSWKIEGHEFPTIEKLAYAIKTMRLPIP